MIKRLAKAAAGLPIKAAGRPSSEAFGVGVSQYHPRSFSRLVGLPGGLP